MSRKRTVMVALTTGLVGSALGVLVNRALASGIPALGALQYSGYLEDATGKAQTVRVQLEVKLWPTATGGTTSLCPMTAALPITPQDGRFSVVLPDTCVAAVKANTDVYAEVIVNGSALGRTKLGAVPYAVEADHAVSATNATTAATANAAGGALKTAVDGAGTRLTALEQRVDLKVFQKVGNNGSVSCDVFCAASQWGPTGTCVGAYEPGNRPTGTPAVSDQYVSCQFTKPSENAVTSLACWCSAV